jgi:hypothetical protein
MKTSLSFGLLLSSVLLSLGASASSVSVNETALVNRILALQPSLESEISRDLNLSLPAHIIKEDIHCMEYLYSPKTGVCTVHGADSNGFTTFAFSVTFNSEGKYTLAVIDRQDD